MVTRQSSCSTAAILIEPILPCSGTLSPGVHRRLFQGTVLAGMMLLTAWKNLFHARAWDKPVTSVRIIFQSVSASLPLFNGGFATLVIIKSGSLIFPQPLGNPTLRMDLFDKKGMTLRPTDSTKKRAEAVSWVYPNTRFKHHGDYRETKPGATPLGAEFLDLFRENH